MAEEKKEVSNPFIRMRNERINMLLKMIKQNPDTPLDDLISQMSLQTGVTRRKIREYLRVLIETGKVEIETRGFVDYAKIKAPEEG